jgi:transcriptional regulator with XRE-family HTH domain
MERGRLIHSRHFGVETMSAGVSPQGESENIGGKVRRLRIEKGYSQDRLALEAHMDQSGLSKFERGGRGLGRIPLTRIARVLGISFEELISGTDFQATTLARE